ncbi:baseplate J protein [Photobacterium damselae subsp. damselae]|uniref:baseplate J/gp47 family protein n=1 Tax=Photobacterium damselae TaxID=38293 RepID=UPI0010FE12C8|nr:baseplate J/gp47 family protein [Photobacterium damselae]TLS83855.1 baseplate J protein [Photobacterium damselae subsp. damselae]TLS91047.1 baseplate J protein [Photobacterium damselae subsp. damselae]
MSLPKAFVVPEFESLLNEYIQFAVSYCAKDDADKAKVLNEAMTNDSELLAQMVQAFIIKRIAEIREQNHQALQMFRKFVTESDMVDLLALQYGLKRQVLEAGNDLVFPPKPPVMESDQSLLQRFDLAPYQFHTTGTRMGYKFHALTLDERPLIKIESEDNAVVMRYEFQDLTRPMPVKDAMPQMLEPNSGKVCVAVLSRENPRGIADEALLTRVRRYLQRDDIGQESDEITTKSAIAKDYRIEVTVYTGSDPGSHVEQSKAEQAAWDLAHKRHQLKGIIDREEVAHIFYQLGAKRAKVHEPAQDIICQWDEAPYCTEVIIHVRGD